MNSTTAPVHQTVN